MTKTKEEREADRKIADEKAARNAAAIEVRKRRAQEVFIRVSNRNKPVIVEVGVELGRFSHAILETVPGCLLYMVDNWLPHRMQPPRYVATKDPSAFKDAQQQEARYQQACLVVTKFSKRARILKLDSMVAAASFDDNSIDLVFIDGDHSFAGVTRDIQAWWPKVRPGGWLSGHDYYNPSTEFDFSGVARAVDEKFMSVETGYDYTWWKKK